MKEWLHSLDLLTAKIKQKKTTPSLASIIVAFFLVSVNIAYAADTETTFNPFTGKMDYIVDLDSQSGDIVTTGTVTGVVVDTVYIENSTASEDGELVVRDTLSVSTITSDDGVTIADSKLKVESSDTTDPTISLITTNTAHQIDISLDESVSDDALIIEGKTAAVDTEIQVMAMDGENAVLDLFSGAAFGALAFTANDDMSFQNNHNDGDMIFSVIDGGVGKDITWDASEDKLLHSAGTFNFDDDNLVTTGTVTGVVVDTTRVEYSGGQLTFNDTTTGVKTLAELAAGGGGTPAGADTQVQYNDGGSFGADAGFTTDKAGAITVTNVVLDTIDTTGASITIGDADEIVIIDSQFGIFSTTIWDIDVNGVASLSNINMGFGGAGVDYTFTAIGQDSTGILLYDEDGADWEFDQDVVLYKNLKIGGSKVITSARALELNTIFTATTSNFGMYALPEHTPGASHTDENVGFGGFNVFRNADFGVGATGTGMTFGNAAIFPTAAGSSDLTFVGVSAFGAIGAGATLTGGDVTGLLAQSAPGGFASNGDAWSVKILPSGSAISGTEYCLWVGKPTLGSGTNDRQVWLDDGGAGSGIGFKSWDTRISASSDATEDLLLEADDDILLQPDDQVEVTGNVTATGTITTDNTCGGVPGAVFWGEDSGPMSSTDSGGLEYSYGNGNAAAYGPYQPCSGTVVALSINCEVSDTTDGKVQVAVDGAAQGAGCQVDSPGANNGGDSDSSCAVSFAAGEMLAPITTTSEAGTNGCTVAWWVVYD